MYASRVIPPCFSSPKSIKFELSTLLPFRKYIVFSTLPVIKKYAYLYIGYLKHAVVYNYEMNFTLCVLLVYNDNGSCANTLHNAR